MTIQLGIIGNPNGYYARELVAAASRASKAITVTTCDYMQLQQGIGAHSDSPIGHCQAILVRSMPLGSLEQVIFRMDCLQSMHDRGVRIVNTPKCLETSIDKWLTLHRLELAGLPVPATICCQSREDAIAAFHLLGRDVLVKPLFGGEGRGIIRLQDEDLAWRIFGALQQAGQVLYVQQFVEHLGYDIRILLIGEQALAIRRRARGGWLTNVSQGSSAEPHAASSTQVELARRSAACVHGAVVGVDLLPATDGRLLVLEVNAVPGWRGTAAALQIDVAKEVVEYACCGF